MKNENITVYVDVDDTFVRSIGSKRIPMPKVIEKLKALHCAGVTLYCWSSGGAKYAKNSAVEFGIAELFTEFLPKPNALIDDMKISDWKYLSQTHPNVFSSLETEDYLNEISFNLK